MGHHSLVDVEGETAGAHAIAVWDHFAAVGVSGITGTGFDLVDLSTPQLPTLVGSYRDASATGGDRNIAWSADGRYVFMANEGSTKDTAGVRVVNIADKTRPVFESFATILPNGVHTVFAHKIGSEQYVFALNFGVHLLRLESVDGKATLALRGRYITASAEQLQTVNAAGPDATATRRDLYGHDMTVYSDAALGKTIMYVAYAYEGLRIVDISNPTAPQELGRWVPGGDGAPHYVHSVKTYLAADGRRITVLGAETFEDRNMDVPSPLWVLDTSDLARPRLLSTWWNPDSHGSDHLLFSLHFYEIHEEKIFLSHYHGGVWVVDIADPSKPVVAGYYMPSIDTSYVPPPNCCAGFKLAGIPMTYDIAMYRGMAVAADGATGLYVLELDSS